MAEYILIDQTEQPSHLNGGTMWRLTFYCIDDHTVHEMTVDSSYRNFARSGWNHVVRDPNPWGVYSNLKRTDRTTRTGTQVVTADSAARIVYRCESHEEALALMQASIDSRSAPTTYQNLFEVTT